jgi:hypothetical protein
MEIAVAVATTIAVVAAAVVIDVAITFGVRCCMRRWVATAIAITATVAAGSSCS